MTAAILIVISLIGVMFCLFAGNRSVERGNWTRISNNGFNDGYGDNYRKFTGRK